MIYPKWFPRPKCWLKSLELMICTSINFLIGYILTRIFTLIFAIPIAILTDIFTKNEALTIPITILFTLLLLIYACIVLVLPIFIFAHIHQFLWSEPHPKFPKWLPAKRNLWEGFLQYLFVLVANLIIIIFTFPFVFQLDEITLNEVLNKITPYLIVVLITIIAYFYHLKYWFKSRKENK